MTQSPEKRLDTLEAALIDMLIRLKAAEDALRFEIEQRRRFEAMLPKIAQLPARVDRLETTARTQRLKGRAS